MTLGGARTSIYSTCWSAKNPWLYCGSSYEGKLLFGLVPGEEIAVLLMRYKESCLLQELRRKSKWKRLIGNTIKIRSNPLIQGRFFFRFVLICNGSDRISVDTDHVRRSGVYCLHGNG